MLCNENAVLRGILDVSFCTQPCGTVSGVNVQVVLHCVCTLYIHYGHVGLEQYDAVSQYTFPYQIQVQRPEHVH